MTVAGPRGDTPAVAAAVAAPASGLQHEIVHGEQRAVITQVGATLREYTVGGVPVIDGFDVAHRATDGRGQVLAPWPNRLSAGRYVFAAQVLQAPLNEPSRGTAIHGLVRWLEWEPVSHGPDSVTMSCTLRPQPGYEWQLELEVTYRLAEDGLTVSFVAVDVSPGEAPFGLGFHPYLTVGVPVDDVLMRLPARCVVLPGDPDAEPVPVPVAGTPSDYSAARAIGAAQLDTAYGDLHRGPDGRAVASVSGEDGRTVELWVDESFGYLMVYTADRVTEPGRRRQAVAVEPMTCPPDAFRSGVGLIRLEPGRPWRGSWGTRARS